LFVGFSVDYIVHVGHGYVESIHDKRIERMDATYKHIGFAVIAGCITTLISALFMLGTGVLILRKFGILLIFTLIFALTYSLIFFPAISYIIGPENHQGDIFYWIIKPLLTKFNCCKKYFEKIKPLSVTS